MRLWKQGSLITGFLILGGAVGGTPPKSFALENKVEDLSASVEVAPVFSFSLDNPHVAFGALSSGSTTILGGGRFFNEISCRSNSGRPWYVKAQLLSLKHLETNSALLPSSLSWKVVESTGAAGPLGERFEFQGFASEPVLIYASQGDDERGEPVILRFQYQLTTPPDAPAGNYIGQIIFTMAESP